VTTSDTTFVVLGAAESSGYKSKYYSAEELIPQPSAAPTVNVRENSYGQVLKVYADCFQSRVPFLRAHLSTGSILI
jgi:hypothetical protein